MACHVGEEGICTYQAYCRLKIYFIHFLLLWSIHCVLVCLMPSFLLLFCQFSASRMWADCGKVFDEQQLISPPLLNLRPHVYHQDKRHESWPEKGLHLPIMFSQTKAI
jgi:hypothetical protein